MKRSQKGRAQFVLFLLQLYALCYFLDHSPLVQFKFVLRKANQPFNQRILGLPLLSWVVPNQVEGTFLLCVKADADLKKWVNHHWEQLRCSQWCGINKWDIICTKRGKEPGNVWVKEWLHPRPSYLSHISFFSSKDWRKLLLWPNAGWK